MHSKIYPSLFSLRDSYIHGQYKNIFFNYKSSTWKLGNSNVKVSLSEADLLGGWQERKHLTVF